MKNLKSSLWGPIIVLITLFVSCKNDRDDAYQNWIRDWNGDIYLTIRSLKMSEVEVAKYATAKYEWFFSEELKLDTVQQGVTNASEPIVFAIISARNLSDAKKEAAKFGLKVPNYYESLLLATAIAPEMIRDWNLDKLVSGNLILEDIGIIKHLNQTKWLEKTKKPNGYVFVKSLK